VVRFREGVKNWLHGFKYSNATHLASDFAKLLAAVVRVHYENERPDAVAYVPLFPVKERARTYNQARLLADALAGELQLPLMRGCLERVRDTGTQTHLTARQRAENVRDAFRVRHPEWVEGRHFLLVDDVMTTGATVNECARALKAAGAGRVLVVTVARG
jgi:ComF family protein